MFPYSFFFYWVLTEIPDTETTSYNSVKISTVILHSDVLSVVYVRIVSLSPQDHYDRPDVNLFQQRKNVKVVI